MPELTAFDIHGNPPPSYNAGNRNNGPEIQISQVSGPAAGMKSPTHVNHPVAATGVSPHYNITPTPSSLHNEQDLVNNAVSGNVGSNTEDILASEPMSSLYEITKLSKFQKRTSEDDQSSMHNTESFDDFISRGIISIEEAEELLST